MAGNSFSRLKDSLPGRGDLLGARWAIVGLILLFVFLRWNNFNAPLIRDEGEYKYAAQLLKQGVAPYDHAFLQKPPNVIYSYLVAEWIAPGVFWAPRVLACLFLAAATLLLGWIARLEFGPGHAMPTMAIVTPMLLLPGVEQFTANTEMFLLLALLATVTIYCYGRKNGHRPLHWFLAGFLAATTFLYKYSILPVLALLFVVWCFEAWRSLKNAGDLAVRVGMVLAGAILAVSLELGFFLIHDGGRTLWDCTVAFNRDYLASGWFNLSNLAARLMFLGIAWWCLVLLTIGAIFKFSWRTMFWIGLLACTVAATGASLFGHYYLTMMPFWALLAVRGIHQWANVLARFTKSPIVQPVLVGITIFFLLLPDLPLLTLAPKTFAANKCGRTVFLESPLVARRISEMTAPEDLVWVAASEPQILAYAHRKSPTRFITVFALTIPNAHMANYQDEVIREVKTHPPKLIVWTPSWLQETPQPSPCLLFLNETLKTGYERVGGYVLEGEKSRWTEPLTDDDARASSIIVYRRKPDSRPR
ncbi:MAG TPA: hypothetical protein VN625_08160 [Desulfuromonadaceae bacterium]|nr:hypothetical protein [Desulfuromonadaceae bacterium]